MNLKKLTVDNIYAEMSEWSHQSGRPHPYVMGFIYSGSTGIPAGGITLWWDHEYKSEAYEEAVFEIVDWMNFHNLYARNDMMIRTVPLPDVPFSQHGLLMVWETYGSTTFGSFVKKRIMDQDERLGFVTGEIEDAEDQD